MKQATANIMKPLRFSEQALRWLRLIEDAHGWLSEDECGARPGDPPIGRIPWVWRRHLINRGLIAETVYSDGSWRLDVTPLGKARASRSNSCRDS